ncbi:MAG: glycoside hydrolase family 3 [Propionibacteriales bacterium]|nr:glycoside hydrolase family 3 [Propionibacteriales bacterium]
MTRFGRLGRAVTAVALSLLVAGCGTQVPMSPPIPTPSASSELPVPPSPPRCTAEAAALSVKEQAGQLIMVGVSVSGLTAAEKSAISKSRAGAVILMGTSYAGVSGVAKLTAALQKLGDDQLLIATDQEGGLVQRLHGTGFATIPSAAQQAKLSDEALVAKATSWGQALADAGVNLDLAPVADVVPPANRGTNRPVARLGRGYGSDPALVSAKVLAFRTGMKTAGVATAVKHFPGLGAVVGNTDFATRVVDATTTADSSLLLPFQEAVAGQADAVMVSSAIYTKIDPKNPALFSSTVIGLLRDWGYDQVVISDDLGVAAAVRAVPAKSRAVRFVSAGGDLAITVNPRLATAFAEGLVAKATQDPAFADRLETSVARVLRLKQSLGLVTCG